MNKATEEHQCQWKLFYVLEFRREVEIPKSEKKKKSEKAVIGCLLVCI